MRTFFLACFIALFTSGQVTAQGSRNFQATTPTDSGLEITLSPWLDARPLTGYVPLAITITNHTGVDGTWEFGTKSGGFNGLNSTSTMKLAAPVGKVTSGIMLAPASFGNRMADRSWESIMFSAHGSRISYPMMGNLNGSNIDAPFQSSFVALSTQAQTSFQWLDRDIDKATARSTAGIGGSKVQVQHSPTEWLGLTGLTSYWMSESEWRALRGPQKSAVLDWVAMGGRVVLAVSDGSKSDEIFQQTLADFKPSNNTASVGLGAITTLEGGAKFSEHEAKNEHLSRHNSRSIPYFLQNYRDSTWKARELVPAPLMQSALIFILLIVFAILAGPVNLFVFAGSERRHRLFWTTPLISLAGTGVLLMMMFISDGTGGSGARLTVGVMVPELDRVVIRQEQISRTGVLLGSSFSVAEPAMINQLSLNTRSTITTIEDRSMELREEGSLRSGDWFQSRSVQAQALQTVRATRGEIRFQKNGNSASLVSSYEMPLKRVWVVDESGKRWLASDTVPGERKTLTQDQNTESLKWADSDLPTLAGPLLKDALNQAQLAKTAYVIAEVEPASASKLAIATLDSIEWKHDQAFLVGPYVVETPSTK